MKCKLITLCIVLLSCIALRAQGQFLTDENGNKWESYGLVSGHEWNEFFLQGGYNPWGTKDSMWDRTYIYYRQIGSKLLLRATNVDRDKFYVVQQNPYYQTNDRYGRGQYEYRFQVSTARIIYFNL